MRGAIFAVAVLLFGVLAPSHAATIYDSDPIPPPDFPTGVGICDGNTIADHFVLTSAATVQSVTYTLLEQEAGSAVINWSFYADAGGLPGAVIASGSTVETRVITPPYDALFATTYFFYLNASFTIPATTLPAGSYWLGLSDPVDSPQQDGLTAASFWCGIPLTTVNYAAYTNDGSPLQRRILNSAWRCRCRIRHCRCRCRGQSRPPS